MLARGTFRRKRKGVGDYTPFKRQKTGDTKPSSRGDKRRAHEQELGGGKRPKFESPADTKPSSKGGKRVQADPPATPQKESRGDAKPSPDELARTLTQSYITYTEAWDSGGAKGLCEAWKASERGFSDGDILCLCIGNYGEAAKFAAHMQNRYCVASVVFAAWSLIGSERDTERNMVGVLHALLTVRASERTLDARDTELHDIERVSASILSPVSEEGERVDALMRNVRACAARLSSDTDTMRKYQTYALRDPNTVGRSAVDFMQLTRKSQLMCAIALQAFDSALPEHESGLGGFPVPPPSAKEVALVEAIMCGDGSDANLLAIFGAAASLDRSSRRNRYSVLAAATSANPPGAVRALLVASFPVCANSPEFASAIASACVAGLVPRDSYVCHMGVRGICLVLQGISRAMASGYEEAKLSPGQHVRVLGSLMWIADAAVECMARRETYALLNEMDKIGAAYTRGFSLSVYRLGREFSMQTAEIDRTLYEVAGNRAAVTALVKTVMVHIGTHADIMQTAVGSLRVGTPAYG